MPPQTVEKAVIPKVRPVIDKTYLTYNNLYVGFAFAKQTLILCTFVLRHGS